MSGMPYEYPVRLEVDYPERSSRMLALCGILFMFPKMLLLLPHVILLYFVNIGCVFIVYLCFWIVFITGNYPRSLFEFVTGVLRWQTRISAWLFGLVDIYPPFGLR